MPAYENGPLTQFSAMNAGVIPNDVYGVGVNFFANRTPLYSRLPHTPVGSPHFLMTSDNYRPRNVALTGAFASGSDTTLTVADARVYDPGDIVFIELEQMVITAVTSDTTATVARGIGGTTAVAHSSGVNCQLVGNTRNGAEVDVASVSRIPQAVVQYCQVVQHAYQVGGALQSDSSYVSAYGTPLDRDRILAMQACVDDFESSAYYGAGVGITGSTSKPLQKGLRFALVTNRTLSPTSAAAYKHTDLIRDTIQPCYNQGGNPAVLLVSTDFLTAFATWGFPAMRVEAGSNVFGTPIDTFEVPFLSGISIVPAPLLRPGTAVCLSAGEVRMRMKRTMFDKPRGSRGDAFEGDIIMEGAIEVDNEAHHAWVSGITAFSAT